MISPNNVMLSFCVFEMIRFLQNVLEHSFFCWKNHGAHSTLISVNCNQPSSSRFHNVYWFPLVIKFLFFVLLFPSQCSLSSSRLLSVRFLLVMLFVLLFEVVLLCICLFSDKPGTSSTNTTNCVSLAMNLSTPTKIRATTSGYNDEDDTMGGIRNHFIILVYLADERHSTARHRVSDLTSDEKSCTPDARTTHPSSLLPGLPPFNSFLSLTTFCYLADTRLFQKLIFFASPLFPCALQPWKTSIWNGALWKRLGLTAAKKK